MGWLRLVDSLKRKVSFAEYSLFIRVLLQKRPIILRSLLIVATQYPIVRPVTPPVAFSKAQSKARSQSSHGVATISRLLKIMGLFCRISPFLIGLFCKRDVSFKGDYYSKSPHRSFLPRFSEKRLPSFCFELCFELWKKSLEMG